MIIQTLMDLARDTIVNWLVGIASLWSASSVDAWLASITFPTAQIGHFLAVLYTPAGWGVVVSLYIAYLVFWLGTLIVGSILGRLHT